MDALTTIATRRTVPQVFMGAPGPDEHQITQLLQAGASAPDHGRLRPWRFITVTGEGRRRLGQLFAEGAAVAQPDLPAAELDKARTAALRAPLIIVVIACPDDGRRIPIVEQLASAAAAAQNILLAAHAMGFAGKWSTGRNAYDPTIKAGLGLQGTEQIIGFLYFGAQKAMQSEALVDQPLAGRVTHWA